MLKHFFLFSSVFLLASTFQNNDSVERGAEIRLTKKGLHYGASIGVAKLQSELQNKRIDKIEGSKGIASFYAENIVIQSINIGSYSAVPIPNVGLRLSVGSIAISLKGRVGYKAKKGWLKFSDHSDVTVKGRINLSLNVKLGATSGKPVLQAIGCSASVSSLDLDFHGGLSWIYNLFSSLLEKKLKDPISKLICKEGQKVANVEANKFLSTFPVTQRISDLAVIDYSFETPEVTSNFIDLLLRGEFLNVKNPKQSSLQPPAFSTTTDSTKMIYVWLSDFTVNSAGRVLYEAGKLKGRITAQNKLVPAMVKPFLNTATLQDIIPQLYENYPDCPIQLFVEAYKAPMVEINPGQLFVHLYAKISIQVVETNGKVTPIFYLKLDVKAHGQVSLRTVFSSLKVGGNIDEFSFTGDVGGSIIDDINVPFENQSIKDMVRGLVIDKANPFLNQGFPIPKIKDLRFVNPSVTIVKNAIRIDTDVNYSG